MPLGVTCINKGNLIFFNEFPTILTLIFRIYSVVDEACFPYTAHRDSCKVHNKPRLLSALGCRPAAGVDRDEFYTVGPAYSLNNETDMMSEIFHSGPVQATMYVYRDFFAYSGGVYRHSNADRGEPFGFHSVKLVGWGEEHDGVKYWVS